MPRQRDQRAASGGAEARVRGPGCAIRDPGGERGGRGIPDSISKALKLRASVPGVLVQERTGPEFNRVGYDPSGEVGSAAVSEALGTLPPLLGVIQQMT